MLARYTAPVFLIDITDNYSGDKCSIYEINQTGMFIWNNIDGSRSVWELAELLKDAIIDDVNIELIYPMLNNCSSAQSAAQSRSLPIAAIMA